MHQDEFFRVLFFELEYRPQEFNIASEAKERR